MTSPGWYPAEGDPPNTERYWDGNAWQGGPRALSVPAPKPQPPALSESDMFSPPVSGDDYASMQSGTSALPGPGWYAADGDPPGTVRYWDGETWSGEAVPAPSANYGGNPAAIVKLSPIGYWIKGWTRSYADFSTRSRRAEYGWFSLINFAVLIGLFILLAAIGVDSDTEELNAPGAAFLVAGVLFFLAAIIPSLALQVRRWHDMGYTGWFTLFSFVPLLNYIVPFVLLFADSKREVNQWGSSPKYG